MLVNITDTLFKAGAIAANNTLSAFFDQSSGIISLEPSQGTLLSSTDFLWTPVWLKSQFADVLPDYASRDICITQGSTHQKIDFNGQPGELYWDALADSICQRVIEKGLDPGYDNINYVAGGSVFGNVTNVSNTAAGAANTAALVYTADLDHAYPLPKGNLSEHNWGRTYANACALKYASPTRSSQAIKLRLLGNDYIGQHVVKTTTLRDGACIDFETPLCSTGDLEGPCWYEVSAQLANDTNLQLVLYKGRACEGGAASGRYFLTDTNAIGVNSQEYGASGIESLAIFERQ